jgi:hypothetical protein
MLSYTTGGHYAKLMCGIYLVQVLDSYQILKQANLLHNF